MTIWERLLDIMGIVVALAVLFSFGMALNPIAGRALIEQCGWTDTR